MPEGMIPVAEVAFGDLLLCKLNTDCLHENKVYRVYRTISARRLYVCCAGPHHDDPNEKAHIRHYLDLNLDPTRTAYLGWEKAE